MCEVGTLTAIGISLAGTAIKVGAASAHGAAASQAARINAAQAQEQAAHAVTRAILPGMRATMRGGRTIAAQRVIYGASGVDPNVGSPVDVARETRLFSQLDEEVIRNNAALEARGFRTKSQAYYQQASYAEAEARNEILSSIIGGVGSAAMIGAKAWLDRPSVKGEDPNSLTFDDEEEALNVPGMLGET